MWFLFGEVSSSSGCLGWDTLFYCGTPWAFRIFVLLTGHYWASSICGHHNMKTKERAREKSRDILSALPLWLILPDLKGSLMRLSKLKPRYGTSSDFLMNIFFVFK